MYIKKKKKFPVDDYVHIIIYTLYLENLLWKGELQKKIHHIYFTTRLNLKISLKETVAGLSIVSVTIRGVVIIQLAFHWSLCPRAFHLENPVHSNWTPPPPKKKNGNP